MTAWDRSISGSPCTWAGLPDFPQQTPFASVARSRTDLRHSERGQCLASGFSSAFLPEQSWRIGLTSAPASRRDSPLCVRPLVNCRASAFPGPVRPPFTRAVAEGGALCSEDTGVLACPGLARTPGSHDGGGVADPPHTGELTVISELTGLGAGTSAGFDLAGAVCFGRWTWADT